ncbi:hypothetical protein [Planktothrix paucivesiculata]|uniref:DUF3368 domain-containing protein n=1 Tax=Planktothrix paucivesiculata PCC 9631 TaxID=671071 RepID=A0A7Z9BPA0_9CYAN|nr:hypothetical protein [Planktothrix paucivesiculata]VXD13822.1 hypothetical protein PL9631_1070005 [Planktothrix paucivesiculata PCC 9631]
MINQIIIADSSPLISLAIIEQLELLPRLYQRVLLPPAVWNEVTVQGLGLPGAEAVSQVKWLEIEAPLPMLLEPLLILVDHGEAEAIKQGIIEHWEHYDGDGGRIIFYVKEFDRPLEWVGDGTGEKGYCWSEN